MYYEVSIKHDYLTDSNEVKNKVDKIIINNVNLFSEAEYAALKYGNNNWHADNFDNDPDITAIKRSHIYEFANDMPGKKIYMATLDDVFVDDNGKEKHMKYLVGLYANDMDEAKKVIGEYMQQMQDFTLVGLNETKFIAVVDAAKK